MIIVFGSINVDITTIVENFPQAGETIGGRMLEPLPGGKGANQALAARRAGSDVVFYGAVGDDTLSDLGTSTLRADGVNIDAIATYPGASGTALITLDGTGENTIIVVPGANARASQDRVPDHMMGSDTTMLLQMELDPVQTWTLAARARDAGSRVIVNLAPAIDVASSSLASVDVLVVNEGECLRAAKSLGWTLEGVCDERSRPDAVGAGEWIAARHSVTTVVTLGSAGAALCSPSKQTVRISSPSVTAVDTVGAGDALVGAFAAWLDAGATLETALEAGVSAGALACTRSGAQASIPHRDSILELMQA
ncbi:MAG: ribokinase [Pseudomonadota bacterium]